MTDIERIEEAHGIWELAVVRLAAMVEISASGENAEAIRNASTEERRAFGVWRRVSDEVCLPAVSSPVIGLSACGKRAL
jgi:hypothetical protein